MKECNIVLKRFRCYEVKIEQNKKLLVAVDQIKDTWCELPMLDLSATTTNGQ